MLQMGQRVMGLKGYSDNRTIVTGSVHWVVIPLLSIQMSNYDAVHLKLT